MAGAIAHHFNNQLGVVIGNLGMAIDDLAEGLAPTQQLTAAMQGARTAADISGMMLTYLGQTTGKYAELDLTVKRVFLEDVPATHRFPIDWNPKNKDLACLEIADTGCGIAEEDIDKFFDPFFSTKFTGRGLDLPVVLGIAKSHGGAVSVESNRGQGTIFQVLLPLSGETALRQSQKEAPLTTKGENRTILVVEDQEIVRNMVVTMLIRLGFKALAAKDGVEAVELFQHHTEEICAVLCDLSMPRMNGWETLSALHQIRRNIPFIIASGYDEDHVMEGNHAEIPQAFLHKPYQMIELQNALARVLADQSIIEDSATTPL